jgi:hypothetical protein
MATQIFFSRYLIKPINSVNGTKFILVTIVTLLLRMRQVEWGD